MSENERSLHMCVHCKARRSLIIELEQLLASSPPDASFAIKKIDQTSKHDSSASRPFRERLDLLKAHYLLGLPEPPLSHLPGSLGSCYDYDEGLLNLSLKTSSMKRYVSRDLRLKSLPAWISMLDMPLKVIDVGGNPSLSRLPLEELCGMKALKEVRCKGCVKLSLPPPEVADQGGEAVVTYLRRVREEGEPSKRMNLILIGNGEAGKTSVLQALKSKHDRADKIDAEEGRTVGIDLHAWEPEEEGGLTFDVMDFGGQAVYSKTNQYFIVRRALYVLVWNVRGGEKDTKDEGGVDDGLLKLQEMTSSWMRAIQARVPGASVMLVTTHIDLAESQDILKQQCQKVKGCVEGELRKMSEELDEMIPPLNVLKNGESFQVNCLRGDGIADLRRSLCGAAKELLWWNEPIPRAFLRLKEEVAKRSHEKAVINVSEYISIVKDAKVHEDEVDLATRMLHEMGVLKYFGDKMRADRGQSKDEEQGYSFEDSVFINPAWMIEVFKGVMRHDWRHLLESSKDDPIKSRKVKKLLHLGIIDEDLLEELWPTIELRGKESPSAANKRADVREAVALLRGCDLAHFLGLGEEVYTAVSKQERTRELLCPGIIPAFMYQHKLAINNPSSLCQHMEWEYNIFPAGFIDRIVVRCASQYMDVDCSGRMAVMRGWGTTLAVSWSSDESKNILRADASTWKQLEKLWKDLKTLQSFFPGMRQRKRSQTISGPEAVQVGFLTCGEKSVQFAIDIEDKIRGMYKAQKHAFPLTSQIVCCEKNPGRSDYNSLVYVLCISTECLDDQGHVRLENGFFKPWNELTESRAIIIPVVLPDYYEKYIDGPKNFTRWWPDGIKDMERYRIFHKYEAEETSMRNLYGTMMMKLRQGQGSYYDLFEVTNQNMLLCQDCMSESSASREVEDATSAKQQDIARRKSEGIGTFDLSEVSSAMGKVERESGSAQGLEQEIRCTRYHRRQMKEVLEFNSSVAPCPSCLQANRLPHFFSRPVCLSKLFRDLTAKTYCELCDKEVDVIDVVPPQVFLSYQWGHGKSTQKMVRQVKREIEERTSLQCWFDVGGGINAGDDHVEKIELGVSRCELFVPFLSDRYLKSANCRREYKRACEKRKYIIPVFVPVLFQGEDPESGWNGSKDKDWWKDVVEAAGEGGGVEVDWTHLASFRKPLELEAGWKGDDIEVSGLEELVAAVQARAYRGAFVLHEERGLQQEENSFLKKVQNQKELLDSMLQRISKIKAGLTNR
eukprot:757656-Hanusia_phi.AAC.1